MKPRIALEIAVQDAAGAQVALDAGADRVELCSALGATGGLTPSPGLLAAACAVGIEVHALIRARPGGFVYSAAETSVMAADIAAAVRAGARGVVIGALRPDRTVDRVSMRTLLDAARDAEQSVGRGVEVTFHRAIDAALDPVSTIVELGVLGVRRVLTSGGAARAGDGIDMLTSLIAAGSGVAVMAGGGVDARSIPALVAVGVDAVHLSAKTTVPDPGAAGPGGGSAAGLEITDPALVSAAVRALRG